VTTDGAAELRFLPGEVTAPAHTPLRVVFRNASTQPHNLTFAAPIAGRSRTIVEAGTSDTIELTAREPGRFAFGCTIHMGMSGTLVVE
jgi:plastocyanin